jgi:hypothetical protein
MRPQHFLLLLVILPGVGLAAPAPGDKDQAASSTMRFSGGIIDTGGAAVYLRHKADAIQAVDLRTGEVRWDSKAAFLPLAADGKRIAALGLGKSGPIVVVFDAKGKVLVQSEPLPSGAWFGEGPTTHSSVTADIEGESLVVCWSSRKSPFSGVPKIAMERTLALGEARIDLATGKVKVVRDQVILPTEKDPTPEVAEPDLKLPAEVVKELEALHQKGCWPRSLKDGKPRPLVVGDQLLLVLYETVPAGRKLVLRSWNRATGKPGEPVTLVEGKELHVISGQGEFLFVQDIARPTAIEQRPIWVVSLRSGKQIARLTYAQAMSPVCVSGDRLLRLTGSVSEGVLESVELETGKSAWSRTFFRYHYSGPFPP